MLFCDIVFLSVTENLNSLKDYKTIVIDAQYFEKVEIDSFKNEGHQVYSYINIGSIENFRDYYLNAYTNLGNSYSDVITWRYVVSKSNINWLII